MANGWRVSGEALASRIEAMQPALDQATGDLIVELANRGRRRRDTGAWRQQARELRAGTFALVEAVMTMASTPQPLAAFTPLWATLGALQSSGVEPLARRARKAAAAYEPIWRELVSSATAHVSRRATVARRGSETDILCERCGNVALTFSRRAALPGVGRLPPDEYRFLAPLVTALTGPTALAAYVLKHLPRGLAAHCPSCDAFSCSRCSPVTWAQEPYSDAAPPSVTCPAGHVRPLDLRH